MGKLNDDELKLLKELTDRQAAPDDDDSFEIEIYDTSQNKGARIPYAKGKDWLHATFGIGQAPAPAEGATGEGGDGATGSGTGGAGGGGEGGAARGYFGRGK